MPAIPIATNFANIAQKTAFFFFAGVPDPGVTAGVPNDLTLALDSGSGWHTPDAAAGVCIGCTQEGWTNNYSFQETKDFCDEFSAAIDTSIDQEELTLEAKAMEVARNIATLQALYDIATYTNTPGNFKIGIGGAIAGKQTTLTILGRQPDGSGGYKYDYWYAGNVKQLSAPISEKFSGKERLVLPVRFTILAMSNRATNGKFFDHRVGIVPT